MPALASASANGVANGSAKGVGSWRGRLETGHVLAKLACGTERGTLAALQFDWDCPVHSLRLGHCALADEAQGCTAGVHGCKHGRYAAAAFVSQTRALHPAQCAAVRVLCCARCFDCNTQGRPGYLRHYGFC